MSKDSLHYQEWAPAKILSQKIAKVIRNSLCQIPISNKIAHIDFHVKRDSSNHQEKVTLNLYLKRGSTCHQERLMLYSNFKRDTSSSTIVCANSLLEKIGLQAELMLIFMTKG